MRGAASGSPIDLSVKMVSQFQPEPPPDDVYLGEHTLVMKRMCSFWWKGGFWIDENGRMLDGVVVGYQLGPPEEDGYATQQFDK